MQISRWQAQHDFDYNRELVGGGTSFSDWLMELLNNLLRDLFGKTWESNYTWWLLAALGAVVVGIAIWYVWRFHPGLFMTQGEEQQTNDETGDTIYGIDFDEAVSQALSREDYREAVRLVYLRTLKALSDRRQIDWQPFKTPSQYVSEFSAAPALAGSPAGAAVPAFRTLTAHFLRVRYGNFPATHELYNEVATLGKEVTREP